MHLTILTDGKMGDIAQCRGVAHRLKDCSGFEALQVTEDTVKPSTLHKLPLAALPVSNHDALYEGEPPQIIIASGRRTLPFLRQYHKRFGKNRPFIAYLKDPAHGYQWADFIWAPDHDGHNKHFTIQTSLSPHSHTPAALQQAAEYGRARFKTYPTPYQGIILGGNSKSVTWDEASAQAFAAALSALPTNATKIITASRRTPPVLRHAVEQAIQDLPHWFWTGEGENPYAAILALSDTILMTGDSHNMVSEALASSASLHIFRPPGLSKKLTTFLDTVEATQPQKVDRKPWDETPLIAEALAKKFQEFTACRVR